MTFVETTIRNRIRNLGLTVEQTALLSAVRKQRLIPGLSGRLPLTNPEIEAVNHTLDRVTRLTESLAPIPVDMTNTVMVEFLLDAMDDGNLARLFTPYRDVLAQEMEMRLAVR